MSKEIIDDMNNRIKTIVNRYRDTIGRDKCRYEIRYYHPIGFLTEPFILIGLFAVTVASKLLDLAAPVQYLLFCMLVITLMLLIFKGRFEKVKRWKDDYVSEEDLLYLCENSFLKERIVEALTEEYRLTYTYFDDKMRDYTTFASNRLADQNRSKLIEQVNNVKPNL